ncbi:phosphoribosylaminoimidazolesuccinocarboxamide synthase [Candidatus Saccharibacteria bacterium]|nr:phosphoribosylaminoimidazolesuccinocarboxamide synthase [Candidatus Saccharibacteria bacterium]
MSNTREMKQEWKMVKQGKVRSVYEPVDNSTIRPQLVALVAGDGVSAFDEKLGVSVPDKGKYLTKISAGWFNHFIENTGYLTAFVTANDDELPEYFQRPEFYGRTTIMQKMRMLPVEAIIRGYITGSAWKAYQNGEREICGVKLEDGLENCGKFKEPIFTPTTKAPVGQHDENLTHKELVEILASAKLGIPDPAHYAVVLENLAINIYKVGAEYALRHGVILADTKLEFGIDDYDHLKVADELFTPDSSRFWYANRYAPGKDQESMDKQIIRNYIADEKAAGRRVDDIPDSILKKTASAYAYCHSLLFS